MSPELKGFCHPLSPEGKSQLIGPPPWHFVKEQMIINYQTDPEQVRRHIPEPLEPSITDPGGCTFRVQSVTSVWDSEKDMIFKNPERCNFLEVYIGVNCSYKGQEGTRVGYIWVDNDFTMLRGWFMGAAKKLGRIYTSFEKRHLYALNAGLKEFGTDTKIRSILEAAGEKLIVADMTLGEKCKPEKMGKSRKVFSLMHFPSIELGAKKPMVHSIMGDVSTEVSVGEVWECKNPALKFFESELEEHITLAPKSITSCFFMSMGLTIKGMEPIYDYNAEA